MPTCPSGAWLVKTDRAARKFGDDRCTRSGAEPTDLIETLREVHEMVDGAMTRNVAVTMQLDPMLVVLLDAIGHTRGTIEPRGTIADASPCTCGLFHGRTIRIRGLELGRCDVTDPKLTLRRDGLGEAATDADYTSWLNFVADRIDEACGFAVDVEASNPRDVQGNESIGADDEQRETITEAIRVLWELWCGLGRCDVTALLVCLGVFLGGVALAVRT